MKTFLAVLLTIGMTISGLSQGIKEDVSNGFKSGDYKLISKHFNSSIDLVIDSNDDIFSKTQAQQILKKFFADHKPSSFKVSFDGEHNNGQKFITGNLETSNGSFRVTINFINSGGSVRINSLRIE